jgi:type VI secretion system protein ImpL
MKVWLPRLQGLANVAGVALLLWLTAPLLQLDGTHPFESPMARFGGLLGVGLLALAAWAGVQAVRRHRNARLFAGLQDGHAASAVLAERFANAMHLLRMGVGRKGAERSGWWQRRRLVYQLPWYVFIGAPGAGKTTALLNAGLRFPLAERLGTTPVAGIGGTRQCDWWFTDEAVFIDTAGRYTTQDSDTATDAQEWRLFLQLLCRYRSAQPINGVIVTVSVPDLLQGGAELDSQAAAVDRRLQELRVQLGLSFPVYLLVTKADLLAGFVDFFGEYSAAQREQVWGITFDAAGVDGRTLPADLAARLATLPARIAAMTPQRLQAEPRLQRRAAIYHFAAQIEALVPALARFAQRAFRHAADAPHQMVRSIHLSSGTQEGNPIDRVLGEISRSYGISLPDAPRTAARGKAYFLNRLLHDLVIAEAPLAGTSLRRRQRRRQLAMASGVVAGSALLAASTAWVVSYQRNRDYVDAVDERVRQVTKQIDPAASGRIDQLLPLYALLSQLANSGPIDAGHAPWSLGFGLFQGPRLARSAEQTYHRVLDRTLAPLVTERLTQALRQETDASARYEALRIGLMMTTRGRLQRDEVRRWAAQAFAASSSAADQAPGAGEQQDWLRHLDALLERNAVLDVLQLDDTTVQAARKVLAQVPIAQRVVERLLRRARAQGGGEQTLADLVSPAAVLALAPQDAAASLPTVPAVHTRQAWLELIEPALEPTIVEVADEAAWVLGDSSPTLQQLLSDRTAREPVSRQVAQRHAQETIVQWDRLLSALSLQVPAETEPFSRFVTTLVAPDSPLRLLLRRIATEFTAPAAAAGTSPATRAYDAALNEHFAALRDYAVGPGATAIDRLVVPLARVAREPAANEAAELARQLRTEAGRAPPPLRGMWVALADALSQQQRRVLERQLGGGLNELAQACRRLTADRFPFAADAKRDMPYADFARVFGPQGLLDGFFRARLAGQVDTRRRPWRLASGAAMPERVQATLRSFEMADDIRRLFFPAGAVLPQLRLQLTPAAMDAELLFFSADVDGQLLRYENGPRRPKPLLWPGPAATQRVLLRILPAGPSGVGAEVHEGPWALLRVLQRRGWQGGSSASPLARLEVDGRSLSVEVTADAPVSANLLGELARFRCPDAW